MGCEFQGVAICVRLNQKYGSCTLNGCMDWSISILTLPSFLPRFLSHSGICSIICIVQVFQTHMLCLAYPMKIFHHFVPKTRGFRESTRRQHYSACSLTPWTQNRLNFRLREYFYQTKDKIDFDKWFCNTCLEAWTPRIVSSSII